MTRLIDADAFCRFLREVSTRQHYEELLTQKDKYPTVADVIEEICCDLDGTSLNGFDNAPTVEFPFVHVIIKHPRFGECDGWLDKQRNLLFFDFITTEAASKWNWSWKEAKNNDEKVD